ncbi:hypothetical protein BC830DRAFT_1083819, partial [Chytriomyces sp. MP71]
ALQLLDNRSICELSITVPTGPARSGAQDRSGPGYGGSDRGGSENYLLLLHIRILTPPFEAPRGDVVFPTEGPFNSYLGNLSYDATENDIVSLFKGLQIKSIRLMNDTDGNPKGFGYCEFDDLPSLKAAVALTGLSVKGRAIRIDVSEGRRNQGGFKTDRQRNDTRFSTIDDSPSDWRSAPRREIRPTSPERGAFGGDRGFGDRGGFGGDRTFGGERGGNGGDRRDFNGPRSDRDGFQRVGGPGAFRRDGPNNFDRQDNASLGERKRLDLKPRTVDTVSPTSAEPASPLKPKANPFGGAAPRDEDAIMRRIEEKQAQKEAERRAAELEARNTKEEVKATEKSVAPPASSSKADEGTWRRDGPRPVTGSKPPGQLYKKSINEALKNPDPKPAQLAVKKVKEVKRVNVFDVLNSEDADAIEPDGDE